MQVSVQSLPDHTINPFTGKYNETVAERYSWLLDAAVVAEENNFHGYWVGEHHGVARYVVPSPQMILAAMAAKTSRLQLGAGVVVLPLCNPLRVAEQFAMLDVISKGRAVLGLGSGLARDSFKYFDADGANAAEMSREKLDAIIALWESTNFTQPKGKFIQAFNDVTISPRTYRDKPLPIVRACAHDESAADAGRRGQKIILHTVAKPFDFNKRLADIYRESFVKAGHNPDGMSVGVIIMSHCVTSNGDKARKSWHQYIDNYFLHGGKLPPDKYPEGTRPANDGTPQIGMFHPSHICGTADEILEMLDERYRQVGGWDELICIFDNGGIPGDEAMDSLRCFGETVIPQLHRIGKTRVASNISGAPQALA
jgi:alkanesulfonate monooxygenase SsuD/methylene tetrahydromethanopterin reductase-like flavin-dependent oxidoreductase (luciferase family)